MTCPGCGDMATGCTQCQSLDSADDVAQLRRERDEALAEVERLKGEVAAVSFERFDALRFKTREQRDGLAAALRIAEQFMDIASDWNIDEAEINGEMRSTYDLLKVIREALTKYAPSEGGGEK